MSRCLGRISLRQKRHTEGWRGTILLHQRSTPPLTEAEAQQLRDLIAAVEHTTLCDETAMGIIREEAAGFFAGQRGAEETARLIQSRMSLYISEQA